MFRDPLSHARSLLSQHLNFIDLQTKDPFILDYMNLIGHNEFGKNVKPFFYGTDTNDNWHIQISKNSIDYWLTQWINTYQWILNGCVLNYHNVYLICYEDLCKDDSLYRTICKESGISNFKSGKPFISGNKRDENTNSVIDKSLIDQAKNIYQNLKAKRFY